MQSLYYNIVLLESDIVMQYDFIEIFTGKKKLTPF